MSPKDIAKLISEDEDDSDGMPTPIVPSDDTEQSVPDPTEKEEEPEEPGKPESKAKTEKPKKTTKKPAQNTDQEYEVDKVTGQPKNGKILYSDTQPKKPVTESSSPNRKGVLFSAVNNLDTKIWAAIEQSASAWNQGSDLGIKELNQYRTNLKHNFGELGLISAIFGELKLNDQIQTFIDDYRLLRDRYLTGTKNPEASKVQFPPAGWWDYTAMNTTEKKEYVATFWGEVATRYLGRVHKAYKESSAGCKDPKCAKNQHIDELIKSINSVNLEQVYSKFKLMRQLQIANFKKKEKSDGDASATIPKETINKLIDINMRYLDELYEILKQSGRTPLQIRQSGLPTLSVKVNDYIDNRYLISILTKFMRLHPQVYEFQAQRFFPGKKNLSPQAIIAGIKERLGIDPSIVIKNNPKFSSRFYTDMEDDEGI